MLTSKAFNVRHALVATALILAGTCATGCGPSSEVLVGDAASGLQFWVSPPWHLEPVLEKEPPNEFQTSATIMACDIDTCANPSAIVISTATVGELIDDPKYGIDGKLDNPVARKRLFERTSGFHILEDVEPITWGPFYGFRVTGPINDMHHRPHPVAADFLIRGRNMICIAVKIHATSSQRDIENAVHVLDQLRGRIRVDGKKLE
jgi:hypothetical protein